MYNLIMLLLCLLQGRPGLPSDTANPDTEKALPYSTLLTSPMHIKAREVVAGYDRMLRRMVKRNNDLHAYLHNEHMARVYAYWHFCDLRTDAYEQYCFESDKRLGDPNPVRRTLGREAAVKSAAAEKAARQRMSEILERAQESAAMHEAGNRDQLLKRKQ